MTGQLGGRVETGKPAKGLGKGLGALLDTQAVESIEKGSPEQRLPIAKLVPSSVQPRHHFDNDELRSLTQSIKEQGVLSPLLVRPMPNGTYEIIAGERRWRASQQAGLTEVPVIIRELDDAKALEVALVENVQRADLNPIDEAEGYLRLVNEFNYTHEDMARVTGKSRSHITNLLRLLSLPDRIRQCVSNGSLTMGHARALLGLSEDEKLQLRATNTVMKKGLSVRETEDLVRSLANPVKSTRGRRPKDVAMEELETRLTGHLGCKVKVSQKEGTGSVRIFFEDQKQMTGLLKKLSAA